MHSVSELAVAEKLCSINHSMPSKCCLGTSRLLFLMSIGLVLPRSALFVEKSLAQKLLGAEILNRKPVHPLKLGMPMMNLHPADSTLDHAPNRSGPVVAETSSINSRHKYPEILNAG